MLPAKVNRLIGQAFAHYDMIRDGDRILVAVSGGIDSLVLCWLLQFWQKKAPVSYRLLAVHLDMGFDSTSHELVGAELERLSIGFHIDRFTPAIPVDQLDGCYHCARQRRNRLFELAEQFRCNRVAFGHHMEDMLETFFLNLCFSGNISTMLPRQELFGGKLSIIRPMAYLEKKHIIDLGQQLGIRPVSNPCRFSEKNKRHQIRQTLPSLYAMAPAVKSNIFAALANVRTDYLPKPVRK
jgi:tRNA 2-thiocytidine biosynthesis protein TtcA